MIIVAYAAMGKSYAAKTYDFVIDLETLDFEWIYDDVAKNWTSDQKKGRNDVRKLNPNFPNNYIKFLFDNYDINKDIILLPPNKTLLMKLNELNYSWLALYPTNESLYLYKNRFKNRGNSEEFIEILINDFSYYKDLIDLNATSRIIVDKDIFISDILEENDFFRNKYYN